MVVEDARDTSAVVAGPWRATRRTPWYVAPTHAQAYGFLNKQGAASAGTADADTPLLCETCLGPNPYVRMSKQHQGKECKVCGRPFTVFRWNPGSGMRFKKTEICTTCAKLKNVCQSCILDLEYHLPTQVRDAALGTSVKIPMSDINRQYFVNRMDALLDGTSTEATTSLVGPSRAGHDLLKKLANHEPDYKRNRPLVCSFYARGACTRGEACPYRHDMPSSTTSTVQSRYHGHDDAGARHILKKVAGAKHLEPPTNPEIKSLFFSGLPDMDEAQLRAFLVDSVAGLAASDLAKIQRVGSSPSAFVHFATRAAAERAASALALKVTMQGQDVRVAWGRRPV